MADEHQAPSEEPASKSGPASAPARQPVSTEVIISWILRAGVLTSALLIALGVLLLLVTGATGYTGSLSNLSALVQYHQNQPAAFPTTPGDVLAGLAQFKPYAFIALGLLLLIATPVIRVAASVVIFVLEHDYAYVFITLFVLIVLVISFLLGKAG